MKLLSVFAALCIVPTFIGAVKIHLEIEQGLQVERKDLKIRAGRMAAEFLPSININHGHKSFIIETKDGKFSSNTLNLKKNRTYMVIGFNNITHKIEVEMYDEMPTGL